VQLFQVRAPFFLKRCVQHEAQKDCVKVRAWVCALTGLICYSGPTYGRDCLQHCAASRHVAVFIPNGVIRISYWLTLAAALVLLGSTQPLREMSTRDISWGGGVKVAAAWDWQPSHLNVQAVKKFWKPQSPRALKAYTGLQWDSCLLLRAGYSIYSNRLWWYRYVLLQE